MNLHKAFLLLALVAAPAAFGASSRPDYIAKNPDGSISARGVYETDANGRVTKYTLFDGTGGVQQVQTPFYGNDGKVVRSDTYDRSGKLTAISVYLIDYNHIKVLDPQGNVIRTTDYAVDPFLRASSSPSAWLDGALPEGASGSARGGDAWTWVVPTPAPPVAGAVRVHQSAAAAGQHEHSFEGASTKMPAQYNQNLYTWVYLDPANPPKEVMVMWKDGNSWEHRAYWGANTITYGQDNSPGRFRAGDLPAPGQWVKLIVPAASIGLANANIDGMGFALIDGRALWGPAGVEGQ